MNPALLQNPYSVDYPLNTDNKYPASERTFQTSNTFPSSEFSFGISKSSNGLSNNSLGQTLTVPTNSGGIEFTSSPSIPEHSYQNPSIHLLSSSASIEDSQNSSPLPSSSTFNYSGPAKFATSNASSTDQFNSPIAGYSESPWNMQMMTDMRNRQPQLLQPTISPQLGYNGLNGTASLLFTGSRGPMEPTYSPSYQPNRSYAGHDSQALPFRNPRTISFPTSFSPFPVSGPYQMAPQPAGRVEGPPFEETKVIHPLVTSTSLALTPDISATIQKGFFQVDGKWTCYRRNYFTVACSFSFKGRIPDGPVYLQRQSQLEPVHQYAVSISARTANGSNSDTEVRQLVQHTPKRDKATETVPTRHVVAPTPPQSHQANTYLNSGQSFHAPPHVSSGLMSTYETYGAQNHLAPPTTYTFERIQFQKATANNGKRRAQQQYFQIIVELSVNISRLGHTENWITVATKQSYPMVVRGRSPGHYKDNVRRDGQTHMDPDHGSGSGGDRGSLNLPMPSFMGNGHSSNMDWTPSHLHNHHYGGPYTRCSEGCSRSPFSADSSTTMTESPTEGGHHFADSTLSKAEADYTCERLILSPILNSTRDSMVSTEPRHGYSKKRCFDEAGSGYEHDYYNNTSCTEDGFSPRSFELSSASHIKPLCAS